MAWRLLNFEEHAEEMQWRIKLWKEKHQENKNKMDVIM